MTGYDFVGDGDSSLERQTPVSPWETYANHRSIITGFIKSSCSSTARNLCVLGAGFCFDLELKQLIDEFDEITLVDISQTDIHSGLVHQGLKEHDSIKTITGFDVSGVDALMDDFFKQPDEGLLDKILASLSQGGVDLPEKYDCIASTCLLSQLLFKATSCIGENHARFVEVLQEVRLSHIRMMMDSLAAGGTGVLFTDFVSSESLPALIDTTCLLYTSPSPRDRQKSRMPSSA